MPKKYFAIFALLSVDQQGKMVRDMLHIVSETAIKCYFVLDILREELSKLGPTTFAEFSVMFWFCILLLLWLTRSYLWNRYFKVEGVSFVSDGTSAILVTLVFYAWPRNLPFVGGQFKSGPPILTWEAVEKRLCWGVVFLLGGGFAIGTAVQKTGLSALLG